mgnify:CR=1 FL=1
MFLPVATTAHGERIRDLMARDLRAAIDPGRRLFVRHGITVLEASPFDSLDRLIGQARGPIRSVAALAR